MKYISVLGIFLFVFNYNNISALNNQNYDIKDLMNKARNIMYQYPLEAITYANSAEEKADKLAIQL